MSKDELFDELFGEQNLNQRTQKSDGKRGTVLFNLQKENDNEYFNCSCGTNYFREKNHGWRSTLVRRYKLRVDHCYIYCHCNKKIFEVAVPNYSKEIVAVQRGELAKSTEVLQIDTNIDLAINFVRRFLEKNKKQFSGLLKLMRERESKAELLIKELFYSFQKVAAYYSKQTPNSKILKLNGLSFSPKDGIGNVCSSFKSNYEQTNVLKKVWTIDIDKMKIHPRLKEILRAMKMLNYYEKFFRSGDSYRRYQYSYDYCKINTFDINSIFEELQGTTIIFNKSSNLTAEYRIYQMGLNQRIELAYNYVDHHNRQFLALKNLVDIINLHFSNEFFILLKLKDAKRRYGNK